MKWHKAIASIICLSLLGTTHQVFAADSWPGNSGSLFADSGVLGAGYEPSGIVSINNDKYVSVGDDGDVTHLDSDGSIITTWSPGGDLEGITTIDGGNFVYVGVEHPDAIKQFDLDTGAFTGKQWNLETWMTGASNQGLEALTFVPNAYHSYADGLAGGLFYAGLQATGEVHIFDIDLTTSNSVDEIAVLDINDTSDISGLHFEEETEMIYAIFDGANELIEFLSDGTVSATYTLPGNDQEGITLSPNCDTGVSMVYIAEDVGPEIWKYESYPIECAVKEDPPVDDPVDDPPPDDPVDDPGEDAPEDDQDNNDSDQDDSDVDPPINDPGEEDSDDAIPNKPTKVYKQRIGPRKLRIQWRGTGDFYRVTLYTLPKMKVKVFDTIIKKKKTIKKKYIKKNKKYLVKVKACSINGCSKSSRASKINNK